MPMVRADGLRLIAHADALRPLVPPGMSMPTLALRCILDNPDVSTIIPACAC